MTQLTQSNPENGNTTRIFRVRCEVSGEDIEAMYDAYDSGMADATTANAVCQALRRIVDTAGTVRLMRSGSGKAEIDLDGYRIPVDEPVCDWLGKAETGAKVDPIDFDLLLPEPVINGELLPKESLAPIAAQASSTAA